MPPRRPACRCRATRSEAVQRIEIAGSAGCSYRETLMSSLQHRQFSVVIPLYNRRNTIARAVSSCLSQMDSDCELVIVDDASNDRPREVIEPLMADDRITFVQNPQNRGAMRSRLIGAQRSVAKWVIFLDSDDELRPGGLNLIREAVATYGANVERIGFRYLYDDGSRSPLPTVTTPTVLDFEGYMLWCLSCLRTDALWVTKRSTFSDGDRAECGWSELLYHFDFSSRFRTLLVPITAGTVHTDGADRQTTLNVSSLKAAAKANRLIAAETMEVLSRFGEAMLRTAPLLHRRMSRGTLLALLAADRGREARQYWRGHLSQHCCAETIALYPLTFLGSRVTKALLRYRRSWRSRSGRLASTK